MGDPGTLDDNVSALGAGGQDVFVASESLWYAFPDAATFTCTEAGC